MSRQSWDEEAARVATRNQHPVHRRRARKHLSLRALARQSDLDHATIQRIEHGLRPSAAQIAKLAKGLGVRASDLKREIVALAQR